MHVVWSQVAIAGVIGGFLALERRAFLQAMLSRPLVAATLVGLALDDVESGIFVGMVLELFHLGSASLGASLSENDTLAATGTAAAAAALAEGFGGSTPAVWSLALLAFAPLGPLGQRIDRALDRYTVRLARTAQSSVDEGNLKRAIRQNLWGMWPHFVVYACLTVACYQVGMLAAPWLHAALPLHVLRGLAWAWPAMASVAAAIAARGSHAKRAHVYAGAAAAVVAGAALVITLYAGGDR